MRYLLDTHIILWGLVGSERLSKEVRDILIDPKNEIYYSTASTWEIEIKHLKKKEFKLSSEQFAFLCDQNGLLNIQINNKHIAELKNINITNDTKHNDPFDKLLLAQAISENLTFITHDRKFANYSNYNILLI